MRGREGDGGGGGAAAARKLGPPPPACGVCARWLPLISGGQPALWGAKEEPKGGPRHIPDVQNYSKTLRHWGFPCDPSTQY